MTPRRVLIVEDNVPQAETLALVLRSYGHTAYHAPTTTGARLIAETHPPDAVVLDVKLPGGGAREFLDWLRARPKTARAPVVVTTGLPREDVADFEGMPWVSVFEKGGDVPTLLRALGVEVEPGGER